MDKRFKALTAAEEMQVRKQLAEELAANPQWPVPDVIRKIRTALRLTIAEYAQLCGVADRTLANIERGETSPTLVTADKLLRPIGMRVGAISAKRTRSSAN